MSCFSGRASTSDCSWLNASRHSDISVAYISAPVGRLALAFNRFQIKIFLKIRVAVLQLQAQTGTTDGVSGVRGDTGACPPSSYG